jgi:glycosyltransferase involved in cell wall biosynthesis
MEDLKFNYLTKKNYPKLSVVIPYFNQFDCVCSLCDNIDSYLSNDIEVLLMDDCSTDESFTFLYERFSAKPNVRLIRQEKNIGPLKNVTAGLKAAQGEYVIFSAGDDFLYPQALSDLLGRFNSSADIYVCKGIRDKRYNILELINGKQSIDLATHLNQHIFQLKWNNSTELLVACATQPGFIWTQCICFKRNIATSAGFLPEGGVDDWGLWHNIARLAEKRSIKVDLIPTLLAFISAMPGSFGSDHFKQTERQISSILNYWDHKYKNEALLNATIKRLNACRGNQDTVATEKTIELMAKIIRETKGVF